jgi:Tol biopolymer transport system component
MIRRTSLLLALMVLAATLNAREAVRQQIDRQQRELGLTLASFARKISTVNFSDRSPRLKEVKVSGEGRPLQGAISRDGESIAFEISFYHPARWTLGVSHSDGTGLQEYPNIASPSSICWANNKSTLALNAEVPKQPNGALLIVRLDSHATQQIDAGGSLTSQCWSPDDKQIVYGVGKSIRIYDLGEGKWRELAEGEGPAWSPDGDWIAFYHDAAYYAIRPSGADQKLLFRKKGHSAGPWWSPDSALVAYMCASGKGGDWMGFETRQLRVRRLADSSDDWVLNEPDDSFSPQYQWVLPRQTTAH